MRTDEHTFIRRSPTFTAVVTILILFISILFPLTFHSDSDVTGETDPPIIHAILVNGKDEGTERVFPYQSVNVSALINNSQEANVTLMLGDETIVGPLEMEEGGSHGVYWKLLLIPDHLEDIKDYSVVVRASNYKGSDTLTAGRTIRTTHLRVDAALDRSQIHGEFSLVVTTRTWDDRPVTSGNVAVSRIEYLSADDFSTVEMGEKEVGTGGTSVFHGNLSVSNITGVRFDIDAVDNERSHLGRTSIYALAVPFFLEIACDREIETIQGTTICGPYLPGETMNVGLGTEEEVENVTLEIYPAGEVQDLVLGDGEPLSRMDIGVVNGSWNDGVPAPDGNGSYILVASGEREDVESISFLSIVVQEMIFDFQINGSVERNAVLSVTIEPDVVYPDAEMLISIGNAEGAVLLSDESAVLVNESTYRYDHIIPLYALNGSYYLMASYQRGDHNHQIGVAYSEFNVTGGPTSPPPLDTDPVPSPDDDERFPVSIAAITLVIFVLLFVLMLRGVKQGLMK